MSFKFRSKLIPYLFLAPALIWYLLFLVYPMLFSLFISFTNWDGLSNHFDMVGVANYYSIFFADDISRLALKNNLLWTAGSLIFPTIIGLLLAVILDRKLPARNLFRAIFYGPGILPLVAVGLIWAWMYNGQFGFVNEFLKLIG
ncbi:MAG: sugar ABC transporter permease, partial [Chloroflexota bacterium]|nr:sugar ABC transporter permease [Chloroflexota bacterium]